MLPLNTVPAGTYFGFTYAELQAELIRYKTEVQASRTRLSGASVNGQSYQFGNRDGGTLEEWSNDLQTAMACLRPDMHARPATNSTAVRLT